MNRNITFVLKNLLVIVMTILVFGILSKLLNGAGNMPQSMLDAYKPSIFIKNNMKELAIIVLCSIILVFLLIGFHVVKDGIHHNKLIKGVLYGSSFGFLWFLGFMELIAINNSEKAFSHMRSGIRDFICLSLFGLFAGLVLCKNNSIKMKRERNALWAVPFIAVFFALFQLLQYHFTFKPVYQRIDSFTDIIWLVSISVWIGLMYYLFSPGLKFRSKYLSDLFFAFFIFGTDWILYNLFYNIFLDIPVLDVILRTLSGSAGIFIGLVVYHAFFEKRKCFYQKGETLN